MALGLGGADVRVVLVLGPLGLVGAALVSLSGVRFMVPAAAWIAAGLSAYTAVQAIPLPLGLLREASPSAATIWARALYPLGESVQFASFSLDPGATVVEAFKWLLYSVAVCLAAIAAHRKGSHVVASVLFSTALLIGLCTIGHGLAGASTVFGVYEPRFATGRWNVGPLLNSNNLAGFSNIGLFCGLGLAASSRFARYRWLILLGVAVLVATCILSGSRAGVSAILVGGLVFAIWSQKASTARGKSNRFGVLLVLALVLGSGVALAVFGAREGTWSHLFDQEASKLGQISRSLPIVGDYAWFGVGRGAFESISPAYAVATGNAVAAHVENFIVQWAVEWGLPVAIVALLGFAWALRLGGRTPSIVKSGLVAGLAAVVAQNLLDMGLELPALGLAVAAILGVLRPSSALPSVAMRLGRRGVAGLVVGASGLVWGIAVLVGRWPVADERLELEKVVEAHLRGRSFETAGVVPRLRTAMLRHPADPYFPRLGALVALSGRGDPMPWLNRALELGVRSGRTRLLLARALQRQGALGQALVELRSAAELEPALAATVGTLAARWTQDPELLRSVAPGGSTGAVVLVSSAAELEERERRAARKICLDEAVLRDASYVPARRVRARHVLSDLRNGTCPAEEICAREIREDAAWLGRLRPESAEAVLLRSELLQVQGKPEDAAQLLDRECHRYRDAARIACLRQHFRLELSLSRRSEALPRIAHALMEACAITVSGCHEALIDVGRALSHSGAWRLALIAYERAALQGSSLPALIGIAACATELGELGRARRALEEARVLAGSDPAAQQELRHASERVRRALLHRAVGEP